MDKLRSKDSGLLFQEASLFDEFEEIQDVPKEVSAKADEPQLDSEPEETIVANKQELVGKAGKYVKKRLDLTPFIEAVNEIDKEQERKWILVLKENLLELYRAYDFLLGKFIDSSAKAKTLKERVHFNSAALTAFVFRDIAKSLKNVNPQDSKWDNWAAKEKLVSIFFKSPFGVESLENDDELYYEEQMVVINDFIKSKDYKEFLTSDYYPKPFIGQYDKYMGYILHSEVFEPAYDRPQYKSDLSIFNTLLKKRQQIEAEAAKQYFDLIEAPDCLLPYYYVAVREQFHPQVSKEFLDIFNLECLFLEKLFSNTKKLTDEEKLYIFRSKEKYCRFGRNPDIDFYGLANKDQYQFKTLFEGLYISHIEGFLKAAIFADESFPPKFAASENLNGLYRKCAYNLQIF